MSKPNDKTRKESPTRSNDKNGNAAVFNLNKKPPLAEAEADLESAAGVSDIDPESGEPVVMQQKPKDQVDGGSTVGEDEVDRASLFSYYMVRDFRYYFQHPYARLFIAYFVTFCNFLIYAEDPVAHSEKECFIPVVGNCFSFVCTRYPKNGWAFLKVLMWVIAIATGIIVGKLLVHQLIFSKFFKLYIKILSKSLFKEARLGPGT